jgi:hypothetical protein
MARLTLGGSVIESHTDTHILRISPPFYVSAAMQPPKKKGPKITTTKLHTHKSTNNNKKREVADGK